MPNSRLQDFVTPEPEPATTVIEGGPERETAHQLQWVYNADRTHDDIFITQDEGLRFIWSKPANPPKSSFQVASVSTT